MPAAKTSKNHKKRSRSRRHCRSIVLALLLAGQSTTWAGELLPTGHPQVSLQTGSAIDSSPSRRNAYTDSRPEIDAKPLRFPAFPDEPLPVSALENNSSHALPTVSEPSAHIASHFANQTALGAGGLMVGGSEIGALDVGMLGVGALDAAGQTNCEPFSEPWHLDFSPTPMPMPQWEHDYYEEQRIYDDKNPVPVQRPLLELGRDFYGSGIRPPSETWLGRTNLVDQQLYLYGDYRTGIAAGRNQAGRIDNWASRLNLDFDYRITSTERFHMFIGPLNQAANNTNVSLVDNKLEYNEFYNLVPLPDFSKVIWARSLAVSMAVRRQRKSRSQSGWCHCCSKMASGWRTRSPVSHSRFLRETPGY